VTVGPEDGAPDAAASDAGELGPPPAPGTRWDAPAGGPVDPPAGVAPAVARPRRRRVRRVLLTVVLVVLVAGGGFLGGLAASDRMVVPSLLRADTVEDAEREADLIGLLEDIVGTEGVMLAFNTEVEDRLADAPGEDSARLVVATAAARGLGGLEALRPSVLARSDGGRVGEVRDVYLPHLDAWIEYFAALAERPSLLFEGDGQQPYLLLINATAEEFADVLEALLDEGPSARAAELAERILDDGFRSEGPTPSL